MKVGGNNAGLPAGFTIRLLQKNDATVLGNLVRLFHAVFEDEMALCIDEAQLEILLNNQAFLAFAAFDEMEEVVGGLTAYILPRYQVDATEAFIFDVAVNTSHQRKGIGLGLLNAFRAHCSALGIRESFVPAHEEDEHALDFYRKAGGAEERVRMFVFGTDAS